MESPKLNSLECVCYEKHIDTHAIVSVTIPMSDEYKYMDWDARWHKRVFQAGEVVGKIQKLINSRCPGYNEIKCE